MGQSTKNNNGQQVGQSNKYTFVVGFFGGLFSSLLAYIAHFFTFLSFGPGVIFQSLAYYHSSAWFKGPWGHLLAMLIIALCSMLIAYIYYFFFRKIATPWLGICFGLVLWMIIFLGINSLIPGIQKVGELPLNTTITLICIFIFYGLFVGYSISFEYQQNQWEQAENTKMEGK